MPIGVFDSPPPSWAGSFILTRSEPDWQSRNFLPGALLNGNGGLPALRLLETLSTIGPWLKVWDIGP